LIPVQIVDNKLSKQGFYEMVKTEIAKDVEKQKVVVEILKQCGQVTDVDRCEAAAKIEECISNLTEFC